MNKKIAVVLALLILLGITTGCTSSLFSNPEKQILGTWTESTGNIGVEFSEDGKVKIPIGIFDLPVNADIDGEYTLNKKEKTVTFAFSVFTINYERTYVFEIDKDTLILTNPSSGKKITLIRQVDETEKN